ncbi:MAG: hypothetical protein ABI946_00800 [Chthoniobacterales bacterium]
MSNEIVWTRTYNAKSPDGHFKAFTSKHASGECYATLLYYKKKADVDVHGENSGIMAFGHKTFNAKSEDEAIGKLLDWAWTQFTNGCVLEEAEAQ